MRPAPYRCWQGLRHGLQGHRPGHSRAALACGPHRCLVASWLTHVPPAVENGHIKRITDGDIQSSVLEVASANVATTYITCPADPEKTLGIKLPFLVMIIKNLNRYFSFEVQVLDDKNVRRRFRASNYQVRAGGLLWLCLRARSG